MRRLIPSLLLLPVAGLAGALFSPVSTADELWHGAWAGMSVEQVAHAIPDAHPVNPDSHIEPPGGKAYELLRVDGIALVSEAFSAHFYFLSGKLRQVMLTADGITGEQNADVAYLRLVTILSHKYGAATAHDVKQGVYLTLKSYDWIHGQTNINLTFMHSSRNGASVLNVNYRDAVDADQL